MIEVLFPEVLVLNTRFGNSKAGNPYGNIQFLDRSSLQVYDVMVFGDAVGIAAGLTKGDVVMLGFELMPDRNGGVRLELSRMGAVTEGDDY